MTGARLAALTAALTFLLLLVGNVVWSTGSSLACPDWPTCHGSFFPAMQGGVLYEHSHRLIASLVGALTIGCAWLLTREREQRRLVIAGWAALGVVIFQGVLGGLTVLLELPPVVSVAHLTTAMAFFSLLIWIAWIGGGQRRVRLFDAPGYSLAALGVTYGQIVLGGVVRHAGAAAACTDIPLCAGQWFPSALYPAMQLHMVHRWGALVVCAIVALAALKAARTAPVLAGSSLVFIAAQLVLGVFTVIHGLDIVIVTAHLGVAALLLGNQLLLALVLAEARSKRPVVASFSPLPGDVRNDFA